MFVAVDADPRLPDAAALSGWLGPRLKTVVGGTWRLDVEPAPDPVAAEAVGDLDRLDAAIVIDALPKRRSIEGGVDLEAWLKQNTGETPVEDESNPETEDAGRGGSNAPESSEEDNRALGGEDDGGNPAAPTEPTDGDSPSKSDAVLSAAPMEKIDKVLVVAITIEEGRIAIAARDVDIATQLVNAPIRQVTSQRVKVGDIAADCLLRCFAARATLDEVDGRSVTVNVRAAALTTGDPDWKLAAVGTVFLPVLRLNDRYGNAEVIRPVEWTFLQTLSDDESPRPCALVSGLRNPLSGRRRGRVETYALAVVPSDDTTTVALHARDDPAVPLANYSVHAQRPGQRATNLLGYTASDGRLELPPTEAPLLMLYFRHGTDTLARVPVAPGWAPEVEIPIFDDRPRLAAEGRLLGIRNEVLDLVIRREIVLARINNALTNKKMELADELLNELRGLRDQAEDARVRLDQERSLKSADPFVQARLARLVREVRQAVETHLSPGPVEEAIRAVERAKQAE